MEAEDKLLNTTEEGSVPQEPQQDTADDLATYLENVLNEHTQNITLMVAKLVSDELERLNSKGEVSKSRKTPMNRLQAELDELKEELRQERIQLALREQATKHGLNFELYSAYLNGKLDIGDDRKVFVKEGDEAIPLSQYTESLLDTNTGKQLVMPSKPNSLGVSRSVPTKSNDIGTMLFDALLR